MCKGIIEFIDDWFFLIVIVGLVVVFFGMILPIFTVDDSYFVSGSFENDKYDIHYEREYVGEHENNLYGFEITSRTESDTYKINGTCHTNCVFMDSGVVPVATMCGAGDEVDWSPLPYDDGKLLVYCEGDLLPLHLELDGDGV